MRNVYEANLIDSTRLNRSVWIKILNVGEIFLSPRGNVTAYFFFVFFFNFKMNQHDPNERLIVAKMDFKILHRKGVTR